MLLHFIIKKKGGGFDDFRRIQEESRGTFGEEMQLHHSKCKEIDSSLRRRLPTIFKRQLESLDCGISDDSRILKYK